MEEPIVRLATSEDAVAIESLILEWARKEWPRWRAERLTTILQALEDDNHLVLVASIANEIVGVLHFIVYPDVVIGSLNCHLNFLLVKEKHRGKGVGHCLLNEAVKRARGRGAKEMHVDTVFDEAARFYREHGFKNDGLWLELPLSANKALR